MWPREDEGNGDNSDVLTELPSSSESARHAGLAVDRDLVRRIVLSAPFAKSPKLSHFLRHICAEAEAGRQAEINEQSIGIAVFGRSPNYDSSGDSIVRSHASRLRHRLREFFEGDGLHEPVVLTIPKGSYVPRFESRMPDGPGVAAGPVRPPSTRIIPSSHEEIASWVPGELLPTSTGVSTAHRNETFVPEKLERQRRTIHRLQWALVVTGAIALASVLALYLHFRGPAHQTSHIFWSGFLGQRDGHPMIVESDSGLVMLQHLTHQPVSLASYISGAYMKNVLSTSADAATVAKLASKRYTPVVDSFIYERVSNQLRGSGNSITFRFARDLRLDELKQGNAILLGTRESNPWVELFEPSMNFAFETDLIAGTTVMRNRHPAPGERAEYSMEDHGTEHTVYGLIAYRPNLTHTGHVLVVEGQTVAGTQSASEFLLDDSHLLPFLTSIRRPSGAIPHFELLLRSSSVGGESSRIETVAMRVESD